MPDTQPFPPVLITCCFSNQCINGIGQFCGFRNRDKDPALHKGVSPLHFLLTQVVAREGNLMPATEYVGIDNHWPLPRPPPVQ